MKFEELLYAEIEEEFNNLKGAELGTDEYKVTIDGLTKLVDRAIEIEKMNVESLQKKEDQEIEAKRREIQAIQDKKNRLVDNCINVAGIVIPVLVTIWGTKTTLKFEEEGTVTTIMGRGFINKLLPKN